MKLLHIVGNRPQFVKLAVLHRRLVGLQTTNLILHTGQHFDDNMSRVFFDELAIPRPDFNLAIKNLTHGQMIGKMLFDIDPVLHSQKPDAVIVYGDTNSTLAGALAAKKKNIPLVHIEAGVRTGDETMPEETNRYITDRLADLNFCCTYLGVENLKREGYFSGAISTHVYNYGDLLLDAAELHRNLALKRAMSFEKLNSIKSFVLTTVHRTENTENLLYLQNIISALNKINERTPVVFPLHPKTRKLITANGIKTKFLICDPLGYLDTLALVQRSSAVITDSGGLSREGFFFSKPTLILMQNPFWPEMFDHGNCVQANAITEEIVSKYESTSAANKSFEVSIFGDGNAAEKISEKIVSFLENLA